MFSFEHFNFFSENEKRVKRAEPQILSSVVQHLQLPLSEFNLDVEEVYKQCGIDTAAFGQANDQIPLRNYLAFLNLATLESEEPLLTIKLAKSIGVELLGTLGFLVLTSRTLYDAISSVSYYQNLLQESTAISFTQEGDYFVFSYEVYGMGEKGVREDIEFSLAFTSQIIRIFSNNQVKADRITFRHSPCTKIAKYEELLSVPCHFEQDHNKLYVKKEHMKILGSRYDPNLTQILTNYLDADLRDKNQRQGFADQVKQTILTMQNETALTAAVVCKFLGMSKSTFERRLKQEGTSYKKLHDEIQYDLACQYLKNSHLNIAQVSQLLGFSSAASFTRAFAKWSGGQTPKCYKNSVV